VGEVNRLNSFLGVIYDVGVKKEAGIKKKRPFLFSKSGEWLWTENELFGQIQSRSLPISFLSVHSIQLHYLVRPKAFEP